MIITPCLWFDTQALEAADYYISVFLDSAVQHISYYEERIPGIPKKVLAVDFILDGNHFMGLNGGPQYKHSPAISFVIPCETQEEIDRYSDALSAFPELEQCGWVTDRFNISWQIVPNILKRYMSDPNREKADQVMQAVLKMKRLNILELEAAYRQ